MLNLFLIALICVIVIEYTDFVQAIKRAVEFIFLYISPSFHRVWTLKGKPFKPFECALCSTFWCCLIYICKFEQFTVVNLSLCLLTAFCTKYLQMLIDIIDTLITKIYNKIL